MEIAGKVAVITGGASGLGRATAERFHRAGARVAILDLNEEAGHALTSSLGDRVRFYPANVSDTDGVAAVVDTVVSDFGRIDVCCNFAGIGGSRRVVGRDGPFPLDVYRRVVDVNLIGTFNVVRLAANHIARNDQQVNGARGVIINTASVAAYEGQVGQAAYTASKAGIVGMTITLARDLASLGIRVNTIVPGIIDTPLMATASEETRTSLAQQVVFPKRLGRPEEIALTAGFIVENDYLNGECIRVDGAIRMPPR